MVLFWVFLFVYKRPWNEKSDLNTFAKTFILTIFFPSTTVNDTRVFLFQMKLERAEWGNDLPSVELQLETQQQIHTSVEELGSSVKEARLYEVCSIQNPL